MTTNTLLNRIKAMPLWQGEISAVPLDGGITNVNYVVTDGDKKYVVRLGEDIPKHHVMRFNELSASRAAHLAGLSPAVIYTEPGITVLQFIECATYSPEDVRKPEKNPAINPEVPCGGTKILAWPCSYFLGISRHLGLCSEPARCRKF